MDAKRRNVDIHATDATATHDGGSGGNTHLISTSSCTRSASIPLDRIRPRLSGRAARRESRAKRDAGSSSLLKAA